MQIVANLHIYYSVAIIISLIVRKWLEIVEYGAYNVPICLICLIMALQCTEMLDILPKWPCIGVSSPFGAGNGVSSLFNPCILPCLIRM